MAIVKILCIDPETNKKRFGLFEVWIGRYVKFVGPAEELEVHGSKTKDRKKEQEKDRKSPKAQQQ